MLGISFEQAMNMTEEEWLEQIDEHCNRTTGLPAYFYWSKIRARLLERISITRPLTVIEWMNLGHRYEEALRLASQPRKAG